MNMKKSLLAVAFAGVIVAPAAMAEVTVYGTMHGAYDRFNDGDKVTDSTTNQLNSYESHIGFKGSEDVGSGMSAIWQIESDIGLDSGTGTLATRDTFLGLKTDGMGTVLIGKHDTPYKTATRRLDVFADTAADNRFGGAGGPMSGLMGGGHDTRLANILHYTSPSFAGFSVVAATVFGAEGGAATPPNNTKGTAYSLAGMFTTDNIYAAVAIDKFKAGDTGTGDLGAADIVFASLDAPAAAVGDKAEAMKIGGGFSMEIFEVNAVIERLSFKDASAGTDAKSTNIYVGGKFNLTGNDTIKAAVTKRGNTTGATDGAKQLAVGFDHKLSKKATVYALYTKQDYEDVVPATPNDDPSDLSIGMKVEF